MANFNYNRVIMAGKLTRDPELRETTSGKSVSRFTIAYNRQTSKDEEKKADFFNCVAWHNEAKMISQYFHKGSSISIEGKLQNRSWVDKEGQERYSTEIVVDRAFFVDSKYESPKVEEVDPDTGDLPF